VFEAANTKARRFFSQDSRKCDSFFVLKLFDNVPLRTR
jgi:hypothetical protein